MRITGSLFPRCVVVVDILDWALWEYHNQVNASVRQAPSSQYEEREAVSQLSVCDFSSRAFAGAFKLARDRWSHIPISASTDVADDIDTRTLTAVQEDWSQKESLFCRGLILWRGVNHQNVAEKKTRPAAAVVAMLGRWRKSWDPTKPTLPPIHLNHSQGPETQTEFGI